MHTFCKCDSFGSSHWPLISTLHIATISRPDQILFLPTLGTAQSCWCDVHIWSYPSRLYSATIQSCHLFSWLVMYIDCDLCAYWRMITVEANRRLLLHTDELSFNYLSSTTISWPFFPSSFSPYINFNDTHCDRLARTMVFVRPNQAFALFPP